VARLQKRRERDEKKLSPEEHPEGMGCQAGSLPHQHVDNLL
jgi:hypothetical protein